MRQKSNAPEIPSERLVKDIRRATLQPVERVPRSRQAASGPATRPDRQPPASQRPLAFAASGCDQARVIHKPRLFERYVSADLSTTTA